MAIRNFVITLTGSAQNLGTLFLAAGFQGIDSLKAIHMHADPANANVIYVGGPEVVLTAVNYGFRIEVPVTSIPPAPSILEFNTGRFSLADIQVLGTNLEKLHILMIS